MLLATPAGNVVAEVYDIRRCAGFEQVIHGELEYRIRVTQGIMTYTAPSGRTSKAATGTSRTRTTGF